MLEWCDVSKKTNRERGRVEAHGEKNGKGIGAKKELSTADIFCHSEHFARNERCLPGLVTSTGSGSFTFQHWPITSKPAIKGILPSFQQENVKGGNSSAGVKA